MGLLVGDRVEDRLVDSKSNRDQGCQMAKRRRRGSLDDENRGENFLFFGKMNRGETERWYSDGPLSRSTSADSPLVLWGRDFAGPSQALVAAASPKTAWSNRRRTDLVSDSAGYYFSRAISNQQSAFVPERFISAYECLYFMKRNSANKDCYLLCFKV